jgi:F-type H+-transporting ATPase subunit delta
MTQTAKIYGGALYDLAHDEGLSAEILAQLQVLDPVFRENPDYLKLLSTPSIPKQERCAVLEQDFGGTLQPYLLNFMKILTERGSIREFHGCCEEFRHRYNADNGILEATAITAVPLTEPLREKLLQKLTRVTGKTVDLTTRTDASILGGIRLEMDGTQLDGTVRRKLDDIRSVLSNTVL